MTGAASTKTTSAPDLSTPGGWTIPNDAAITRGKAIPVGATIVGRGFPTKPGVVVSNAGGRLRVDQPGVGVVPWTWLDAGHELYVVPRAA